MYNIVTRMSATVCLLGTPMKYTIRKDDISFEDDHRQTDKYVPGKIISTCIGPLRCDHIIVNEAGEPSKVLCSVPPRHWG